MSTDISIPDGLLDAANEFIDREVQPHVPMPVLAAAILDYGDYWLVSYQTRAALEGDIGQSLAGNAPFRILLGENGPTADGYVADHHELPEPHCEIFLGPTGEITEVFRLTEAE